MISQLVALATQLRKASGLDELEDELELEDLDEELADPHMLIRARRQLALSLELELEDEDDDPARHVLHLAMMLSTALSHVDWDSGGQPVTDTSKRENANPRKARFMSFPPRTSKNDQLNIS